MKVILLSVALIAYNAALSVLPGRVHSVVYVPANLLLAALLLAWSNLVEGTPLAALGLAPGFHNFVSAAWGIGIGLSIGLPIMVLVLAAKPYLPLHTVGEFTATGCTGLLWRLLIWIPMGTVVVEEIAFRGVLFSHLERASGVRWAVLWSSLAFGLWHIGLVMRAALTGNLATESAVLAFVGIALGAFVAGIGLALVRFGTSSLLGPMVIHLAVNSLVAVALWQPQ